MFRKKEKDDQNGLCRQCDLGKDGKPLTLLFQAKTVEEAERGIDIVLKETLFPRNLIDSVKEQLRTSTSTTTFRTSSGSCEAHVLVEQTVACTDSACSKFN